MNKHTECKYEDGKVVISQVYEFDFSDFVILELPKSCLDCPCGFYTDEDHPCGKNTPFWKSEDFESRPASCKLRSFEQYLAENN